MKMDPIREARARRMVLNPESWPQQRFLCMKRMTAPMQFGVIHRLGLADNHIEIVNHLDGGMSQPFNYVYESLDALVADGWTVD